MFMVEGEDRGASGLTRLMELLKLFKVGKFDVYFEVKGTPGAVFPLTEPCFPKRYLCSFIFGIRPGLTIFLLPEIFLLLPYCC